MIPDIRVDWRGDGLSTITNDSFVTNTTGWAVTAGINAAGSSITRATADGVLGGVTTNTCAELVTTATNGSGTNFDFGTTTFTSGRTYRFSVWLKRVSGTTAGRILIGSLGTGADRASSTFTLTTGWVRYTVDWTPSGTRTDVEAIVTNNAASALTVRICLAEAYEAIDDVGPAGTNDVDTLTMTRGASFDGTAEAPGSFTFGVTNIAQKYSQDNASGPLFGLLTTGRPTYIRAIDATTALVYGFAYGTVRRIVPNPQERTAEVICSDALYGLSIEEVSIAASASTAIRDFRAAVLTAAGLTSSQQVLAGGSPECHNPITGADQRTAIDLLADMNAATGSIHYCRPHPSPSVLFEYRTIDRTMMQTAASAETWDDATSPGITGLSGYDVTDEAVINSQRVTVTPREVQPASTIWSYPYVPFTVAASTTKTIWASFPETSLIDDVVVTIPRAARKGTILPKRGAAGAPAFSQSLTSSATNAPTITLTPFADSAKITITTGGSATVISSLSITGQVAAALDEISVRSTTGAGDHRGQDIASPFLESGGAADGLADYVVARYGSEKPRPDVTRTNALPSQVTRDVGDTIALNFGLLSVSGKRFVIKSFTTTVQTKALEWVTTYQLEAAMADTELFTIGGSASEGVGGTGVLAY